MLEDLAVAIRDLEPGVYKTRDVHGLYCEVARKHGHRLEDVRAIGRALRDLGCGRERIDNTAARFINVEGIRRRWPHLPWSE